MTTATEEEVGTSELIVMEQRANALNPADDQSEAQALLFIAECKTAGKRLEERREALVRPHLDAQKKINSTYKPVIDAFTSLWERVDERLSAYRKRKQLAIEEANRKAIAKAEEERKERERIAEEARREAERLRQEAERLEEERLKKEYEAEMARLEAERKLKAEAEAVEAAKDEAQRRAAQEALEKSRAEEAERARKAEEEKRAAAEAQAKLEKSASKLEVKADTQEARAMTVSPEIQSHAPKTQELLTGDKATGKKVAVWMFTNGMPNEKEEYYGDDPRVQDIPDRYFVLDLSKLGRDVKSGVPIPGTKRDFKYTTAVRTAKS